MPIFPEMFTEDFPPVQIFHTDVYLLTYSLSIGFYSICGLYSALIVTLI